MLMFKIGFCGFLSVALCKKALMFAIPFCLRLLGLLLLGSIPIGGSRLR
jgi:hypothetical protein